MRANSVVWILRTYYLSIHSVKMLQEAAADSFLDFFRSEEDTATLHYEYLYNDCDKIFKISMKNG